ncbi:hypothetical protein JVU11DRAFT_206 [Chiua virens]|nr:hypothetical protein JVU11DRAFT_206 [Chiua virens]
MAPPSKFAATVDRNPGVASNSESANYSGRFSNDNQDEELDHSVTVLAAHIELSQRPHALCINMPELWVC